MNILLTNDDGIFAEGIYSLFSALNRIGNVTVVAPDSEKSSVGHGITLSQPIRHKKVNRKNKFFGYGISGTPADCVKFAIGVLLKKTPDLVVSGINLGPNDGCSIFYSGTVAGAREGSLLGIPSVAVSLATFINPDFSYASKFTAKLCKEMFKETFVKGSFLNINIPNKKKNQIKGIKITSQCLTPIYGSFKKNKDLNHKDYYWLSSKPQLYKNNIDIDTYALNKNYITITPVQNDSTAYNLIEKLDKLKYL